MTVLLAPAFLLRHSQFTNSIILWDHLASINCRFWPLELATKVKFPAYLAHRGDCWSHMFGIRCAIGKNSTHFWQKSKMGSAENEKNPTQLLVHYFPFNQAHFGICDQRTFIYLLKFT
jgi:hypothetical protein